MSVETVYILRHGETDLNRELRCQGRQDIPLNTRGREQIAESARGLVNVRIDAVFASPLKRAMESAEIAAKAKNLDFKPLDWLVELNYGGLEGLNAKECEEKYPGILKGFLSDPLSVVFPGGESVNNAAERLTEGLGKLVSEEKGTVLLVTHQIIGGIIRCLLEGLSLSKLWENKLINCGLFQFYMTDERLQRLQEASRR